ncbi:Protein Mis18-beta [Oryzias melastigma]|uniref:Protein Mis18-beta n=1 Tax=Oryzias melastigma TaxID=30732 RepID=A0A834F7L9_ORYME|nr:protein Mis18-beta [Oryzias melastigma]KAF6724154.1 Protein Mis18-beta [Oryzias melastigma]
MEFEKSILSKRSDGAAMPVTVADGIHLLTFHCQHCYTVLADSLHVCGELKSLDSVILLKVTNDVVVGDAVLSKEKGEMINCIYSSLKCGRCHLTVGKVLRSSPPSLASVRSLFLLDKSSISCYILNSSSMVKASGLTFDLKPVSERLAEVREQLEAQLDHMSILKSRLADMSIIREKKRN